MRKSSSLFFYFDVQIYKKFRNTKRFVTFFQNFSQHVTRRGLANGCWDLLIYYLTIYNLQKGTPNK